MCLMSMLSIGCSSNIKEDKDNDKYSVSVENIENHIPYIDANSGEIDNSIISERYENVKKEELTYDQAIELVKKILLDDIKQFDSKIDK